MAISFKVGLMGGDLRLTNFNNPKLTLANITNKYEEQKF